MKTVLITCILFLNTLLTAANPTEMAAIGHCLEEQLMASTWAGDAGDHWSFTHDGALMIFDQNNQTLERGSWELSSQDGLVLNVILGAEVNHYRLAPHCDQERIILRETTNGELVLAPVTDNAKYRATLSGDWQKGFSSEEPFLAFKADGSYMITDVNTDHYQLRTGRWIVIGNTLLLYKKTGEIQAYLIKHLQMDELVLSPFAAAAEDWYLNKL